MLPESVLREAQSELMNWQGSGMSVLEIGHRTDEFKAMLDEAEALLRELLAIPDHYHVLFLGGAARTQFAMIPMNLLSPAEQAGYLVSGLWSSLAFTEATKLTNAYCIASSESDGFVSIPEPQSWQVRQNTAYVYFTPNETINGVRFSSPPSVANIPLVADMTSCLLSEPLNVADYGLIFAGAQKNIAAAGLTIVIIRDDLLQKSGDRLLPTMMDYRTHVAYHSVYATPPVFNCYLAGKMFKWIKAQGGVEPLYHQNCQKAARLYQYIDESSFYYGRVEQHARSIVNVCFALKKPSLEQEFVRAAAQRGLLSLAGHRMAGGLRASLYNAMPMSGVELLIAFMQEFSEEHH
ncbi:phosphoserine aminotransferase [Legionella oakridgensis ATCC 33761 = DSM 21215]|uniref:Phosphoserine aminotransferase n=3 Tax=Legionella oakridgensis TaxID=29423 RepID=W0BFF8_9GAMM|nr:phosphoserine aminotransferase [Legionella oakridgensis ATCC 33761 = DSM 21215]ETO93091.1 phosphoserine aminotransferase apoenzyme [Legionella oakridgensis RV-2-2007]KTD37873.1 phosphoserine aminotransferase [Legionella oakridgensis]STY20405.1 phosphoserine aminotransferase [Legionella longbeachae]